MEDDNDYNLTVAEVAAHYSLSPRTVRTCLKNGALEGVRLSGSWRCCWTDAWGGPAPRGARSKLYKRPLKSKKGLATKWQVSERTVERWIVEGLPTRNVFGSVRIAPEDAVDWTEQTFGATKKGRL